MSEEPESPDFVSCFTSFAATQCPNNDSLDAGIVRGVPQVITVRPPDSLVCRVAIKRIVREADEMKIAQRFSAGI